jgi:orotate phosphoribosyltransferase-like protein
MKTYETLRVGYYPMGKSPLVLKHNARAIFNIIDSDPEFKKRILFAGTGTSGALIAAAFSVLDPKEGRSSVLQISKPDDMSTHRRDLEADWGDTEDFDIVVVDDTIASGNTMRHIADKLIKANLIRHVVMVAVPNSYPWEFTPLTKHCPKLRYIATSQFSSDLVCDRPIEADLVRDEYDTAFVY